MNSIIRTPLRYSIVLLISVLFFSGCSSSSDSGLDSSQEDTTNGSSDEPANGNDGFTTESEVGSSDDGTGGSANETDNSTSGDSGSGSSDESTDDSDSGVDQSTTETDTATVSEDSSTTRVDFDITVPTFMSDALQVRLVWGDVDTTAVWNSDELWTVTVDLPVNTTNQLVVTFSDANGAITLGSFESSFRTGENSRESFQITADEFDTDRWDSDGDGVSNLSESIAGTNPQGNEALGPVQVSLELVQDKTFRLQWQSLAGAQFYRVFENPDGISGFTDISGALDSSSTNYDHVVALYSRTNAEYIVQSCNEQGCADSNTVLVSGALADAVGYIKASNTDEFDNFGNSVSISADGNTLAVGAFGESSTATGVNGDQGDNSNFGTGAVYVFARINRIWQQQAYLKADRNTFRNRFGESLALNDNGDVLIVSAPGVDSETGEAYIFTRTNGSWQQSASILASNEEDGDAFGRAVAISADGKTVAVGAFGESSSSTGINGDEEDNSFWRAGAVYVFVEINGIWQQQAYIKQSNPDRILAFDEPADDFGWSAISLSADGNTLAAGASGEDSAATGINGDGSDNSLELSGAVYVFIRTDRDWEQQAYVKASNPAVRDFFGRSVSLGANGSTMAVGAEGAFGTGSVYMFERINSVWTQQDIIRASNTDQGDIFGIKVSLSSDGNTLAVAATGEDSDSTGINGEDNNAAVGSGAGYVFKLSDGIWQQIAYIKSSNTEGDDAFGRSISLSGDGNTLAVGATGEDSASTGVNADVTNNVASGSGAVYLY